MIVLGIESSHDDTSLSIVENYKVIVYLKISQIETHRKYGGTVPEIASREHYKNFYILLEELKTEFDLNKIDLIAYTEQPGLIGALQMGKLFANSLSKTLNKPLIPINHLEGHIFSVLLDNKEKIKYPSLALVVSGGHTNLYFMKNKDEKELIGKTVDDAAGEVFDKVSRTLYNEFPGGPKIDHIFQQNKKNDFSQYKLTSPITSNKYDFSFSGYKTQIINIYNKEKNINKDLLATSFQKSVVDYIIKKIKKACDEFKPKTIILSGGVSANSYLRDEFLKIHKNCLIPTLEYSTDNGAMIAAAALVQKEKN